MRRTELLSTFIRLSPVVALMSLCSTAQAEDLNVLSPREYQVFQRQGRYDGRILISGSVKPECDKLKVRVTGRSLKGELRGKWQAVPLAAKTRGFASHIAIVPGGWYKVELRATNSGKDVVQAVVERVGVGEVFVGAGQSNSTNCGQFKTKQTSGMVSSFNGTAWRLADDPQWGSHDLGSWQDGSFWPAFGDAMYTRYHVPIGVAVTGQGASSVKQWQPDAPDGLYPWMMTRIYQLGRLGFRALLWHQGESDVLNMMPAQEYVTKLSAVIRQSKLDAGWEFPWFVARASYINPVDPNNPPCGLVRAAQKELWDTGVALEGPDTDALLGDNRDHDGTGVHFSPKGLKAHGEMWAEKMSAYLDSVLGK